MSGPLDSPFSDGHGNDYLFVGNMVYTVRHTHTHRHTQRYRHRDTDTHT